jgi:hypothetical protein
MNNQQPNPFFNRQLNHHQKDRNLIHEFPQNITSLGPSPFRPNDLIVEKTEEKPPEQSSNLFEFWNQNEEQSQATPIASKNFKMPTINDPTPNDQFASMKSLCSSFYWKKDKSQIPEIDQFYQHIPKFTKVNTNIGDHLPDLNFPSNPINQSTSMFPDFNSGFDVYKTPLGHPDNNSGFDMYKNNMTISDLNSGFDKFTNNFQRSDFGSSFDAFKNKIQNQKSPKKETVLESWEFDYKKEIGKQLYHQRPSMNPSEALDQKTGNLSFPDLNMTCNNHLFLKQKRKLNYIPESLRKRSLDEFNQTVSNEQRLLQKLLYEKFGLNSKADISAIIQNVKKKFKNSSKNLEIENVYKSKQSTEEHLKSKYLGFGKIRRTFKNKTDKTEKEKPRVLVQIEMVNSKFDKNLNQKNKEQIIESLIKFGEMHSTSFDLEVRIKEMYSLSENNEVNFLESSNKSKKDHSDFLFSKFYKYNEDLT